MSKMRAVQVAGPNQPFVLVERDIPQSQRGTVRIKVQACGVCHSDSFVKEGTYPGIKYPRIPGHEVAGIIDAIGEDVGKWQVGQKVGVGWNGGYCGYCDSCRRGDFTTCHNMKIPGISYDGGYAEYMIAPIEGLALIPEELSSIEAGPLMCAGITTYNSLRNSGGRPGDLVAILGVGGLGHLAIQFSAKMGFKTIAIARGNDKAVLAKKLGAYQYIDSQSQDPAKELLKWGGAKIILSTVTKANAIMAVVKGLSSGGKLIILGAAMEPLQIFPISLINGRQSIMGWPSGSASDSQDTMCFCSLTGIRSMNEVFPLERAMEAYEFMMSGKARFRVVLSMEN